jgi:flagellar biosynthesis/type III secretory pathway protein FliH
MPRKATILRGGGDATPIASPLPAKRRASILRRELLSAIDDATRVREEAEAAAATKLREAQARCDEMLRAAQQQGYENGLAEGLAGVARIANREQDFDRRALDRSIELARLLAERLVERELTTDADTVRAMAQGVLTELRGVRTVTLATHPADVEQIAAALAEGSTGPAAVQVKGNPTLKRGDFELTTEAGSLAASLGARLDVLARALRESLE